MSYSSLQFSRAMSGTYLPTTGGYISTEYHGNCPVLDVAKIDFSNSVIKKRLVSGTVQDSEKQVISSPYEVLDSIVDKHVCIKTSSSSEDKPESYKVLRPGATLARSSSGQVIGFNKDDTYIANWVLEPPAPLQNFMANNRDHS